MNIQTYRGPKQGKPGRNQNSSQGSVLVSGRYWFVKQCWLVNITGLYRVQVSDKYRFLPQRFNIELKLSRIRAEFYIKAMDRNSRVCLVVWMYFCYFLCLKISVVLLLHGSGMKVEADR